MSSPDKAMETSPKSIYIHMPFCKTKCPYCDFASFTNTDLFKQYTSALVNEIKFRLPPHPERSEGSQKRSRDPSAEPQDDEIETIFFGGGTPSLHSPAEYTEIFSTLKRYFKFSDNVEITLEANPGTISRDKLKALIETGINRISIGVQTFDEKLLQKLGRGHSLEDSYRSIEDLQSLGLKSWSFDLIYGLPGQSLESWSESLEIALSFNPPHISAYALSIETNTPYGEIFKDSKHPDLPQEDDLVEMYNLAHQKFKEQNIHRYEISNWAKEGHSAKHNLTYWEAEEYYAFGLSSHGYINSKRYSNTRDLKEYLDIFRDIQKNSKNDLDLTHVENLNLITDYEKLEERILLGLRLDKGLEMNEELNKIINFEKLESLANDGYINKIGSKLKLSDKAIMVSNTVINQLLK